MKPTTIIVSPNGIVITEDMLIPLPSNSAESSEVKTFNAIDESTPATVEQLADEYANSFFNESDEINSIIYNSFKNGYNTRNADIESIIKEVLKRATQMGRGYSLNEDNFQHKIKQSILNTLYSDLL